MRVKVIPIGQILMLALLIMLIGIGITAVLKKAGASSKARKRMFWGSIIAGLIIVLLLVILRINEYKIPYTWSLYPWNIETIMVILDLVLAFLLALGVMTVFVVIFEVFMWLISHTLDNLLAKISEWYNNLVK